MTEAALQELIKREFPAEMLVTEVADKLDTMQAHPDIEQIRTCFILSSIANNGVVCSAAKSGCKAIGFARTV